MSFEKYRVHEVAKDFGKQTKEITQILSTYATTPKNHMQVLEDKELSIIFEYLTQHNFLAISSWRRRIFSCSSWRRLLPKFPPRRWLPRF